MILNKMSAALLVAIPLLGAASAHAQSNPKLFSPLPEAMGRAAAAATAEMHVVRQKAVAINFSNIDQRAARSIAKIDVDLFDGSTVTLTFKRIDDRGARNYTWYGEVKGAPMSGGFFTVVNGYMTGSLTLLNTKSGNPETYEIRADASGVHKIRQIDGSKLPTDHGDIAGQTGPSPIAPKLGGAIFTPAATATGAFLTNVGGTPYFRKVDTIVLYSQQVAQAAGAAIASQIQAAIDSANETFIQNGAKTRLRLVHSAQAGFSEDGTAASAMNYLASATVNALRTTYGADVVSLIAENNLAVPGGTLCGQAGAVYASASNSVMLVKRSCIQGTWTFTHEVGHLYGARHQQAADPTNAPYVFGHGYVNLDKRWYTMMSTQNSCGSVAGCIRLPLFSSPNRTHNGDVIGSAASHDNARVVHENGERLASFTASKAAQETGVFGGNKASYTIAMAGTGFDVIPSGGAAIRFDSTDNARLQFADGMVALDIEGNAGKAFRLYQAAFNRVPDHGGLGFWIYHMDNGYTLPQVAESFMNSAEFQAMYGTNPSNADFVTKLYNNALHRAPDAGGYDFWMTALNNGMPRKDVLVSFSESLESRNGTAAAVSRGISYTRHNGFAASSPSNYVSPFGDVKR